MNDKKIQEINKLDMSISNQETSQIKSKLLDRYECKKHKYSSKCRRCFGCF